ncbi:hypothetical protein HAX54_013197 [Datura stramonium]|uniref:Cytochrome P450 n=1 Tax=Datura stramonium TaxID=4076 RepID=A0ABS8TMR7_DATST|nr:hypothetical protein [Datura stramonium]
MTALIANPNAMKKVQAEIREAVGKKSIVNEDDVQTLPYFKAVIKETFRLYPPGPLLMPRETMQKSILEGYEIKPKTIIHINVWAIARDPEIWDNSKEFIPERFLNSDIDFKGQNFELISFGAGRRGCPATLLGVATVELVLSNLLYAFDWELPCGMKREDIDTDVLPGLTMRKYTYLNLFWRFLVEIEEVKWVAFGIRYDEETRERRKLNEFLKVTGEMLAGFFVSDYFPLLGWIDKLSGKIKQLENNFKDLDEFYEGLIVQHLNPNRPKSMEGDIVDLLLQLKKEKSTPIDLTVDSIKAIIMDMLIGGTDTAAATVIWAMTALIANPNAMKKVQAEIRESVGKKSIVNEDDVQNLPYFKAVIKETFRLYPPGPLLIARETMQQSILEGYQIKPKTIIHISAWAIARDPEIWDNPEEFIPERFLNSDIDFKGQNFELIPFGAGRRGCPGIAFGVATVELALSNLLYAFDWELPCGMKREDIDTDVLPGLTMHKKNPLCLIPRNYY